MNRTYDDGAYAFEHEKYELPIEMEKKLQRTDRSFWSAPIVITGLTIALSITDALVLYSILDQALMQSEYMGKIMSFTIALVLNFIPLITAKFVHQAIYRLKKFALLWAILSIAAFLVLFAATVYLRLAYRNLYETNGVVQLENQVAATENEEEVLEQPLDTGKEKKSLAVVILLSLEPLVTSIVNFVLAYITDDEVKKRIEFLRIRRLELIEAESDLKAGLENMEIDCKDLEDVERERYETARLEVFAIGERLKARSRFMLAQHLADPDSISKLSQEALSLEEPGSSKELGVVLRQI